MPGDNYTSFSDHQKSHFDQVAKIKVIGVGGGGNNTVHSMISEGISGVTFIVANTDKQTLNASPAENILPLGTSTKGLGAGANPEVGRNAALESEEEIKSMLANSDMVVVAAGMGGGTGTGAGPVICKIARETGALTVGIVTTPFTFEGAQRMKNALLGLEEMKKYTDSLIVVSNNKLLEQYGGISLRDSFLYADMILKQSVQTITDLIGEKTLINLDFADLRTIMTNKGEALIGIGEADGEDKAVRAATNAISSPILEASISGATDAIVNVSGANITLEDANKAVATIQKLASQKINVIFGVAINEGLGDAIRVAVIATGLKGSKVWIKKNMVSVANNNDSGDVSDGLLAAEYSTGSFSKNRELENTNKNEENLPDFLRD